MVGYVKEFIIIIFGHYKHLNTTILHNIATKIGLHQALTLIAPIIVSV